MILFISTRRDGRSLGEMVKTEMGEVAGLIGVVRHVHDHDHHPRRRWR